MKNIAYSGVSAFMSGLIEQGQLGTIAKWIDCRLLTSIFLNKDLTIGGESVYCEKGTDLLFALHTAAKANKLTEEEGKEIVNYLTMISWKFNTPKVVWYLEVDTPESIPELNSNSEVLVTSELNVDEQPTKKALNLNVDNAAEAAIVDTQAVKPVKKAGRPAAKKN